MVMVRESEVIQSCIDACLSCYSVCAQTSAHCLIRGDGQSEAGHLRLLSDCAEICRTTADFLLRGSELHEVTRAACAVICERCAQSCRSIADDPQSLRCAEICERCAATCMETSATARRANGENGVGLNQITLVGVLRAARSA